jgi:hypothetical protein
LYRAERRNDWLVKAVDRRLREKFAKLRVAIKSGGSEKGKDFILHLWGLSIGVY